MVAGRYLLQRQLGRGAAKDVWLAHDLTLDRGVALARVSGPGAWERLRREARLTARLGGHRHIVTVHDVFEDDSTPCLVARYMTGGSLADRLERAPAGRLEPQEVIAAGREIANALAHAHAHGVVHRDVKPDNVWIDAEGEAALGDFGVAVAEGESAPPAGTPRYAAPEQTLGEAATPLSDLFALGVTLYELLCGVRPFDSKDLFRMRAPSPPSSRVPGVPEALDRLILALVAPDPADRPQDAAAVCARARPPDLAPHRGGARAGGRRRPRAGARAPAQGAHPGLERLRAHDRDRGRERHRQDDPARRAGQRGLQPRRRRGPRARRGRGPPVRRLAPGRARAQRARRRRPRSRRSARCWARSPARAARSSA